MEREGELWIREAAVSLRFGDEFSFVVLMPPCLPLWPRMVIRSTLFSRESAICILLLNAPLCVLVAKSVYLLMIA